VRHRLDSCTLPVSGLVVVDDGVAEGAHAAHRVPQALSELVLVPVCSVIPVSFQWTASLRATAANMHANDRTAARTPTMWKRSARSTCAFQSLGDALNGQSAVALLIGTVPTTLIAIQMSRAITAAHH
jgi:hypothetical protein